MSLIAIFGHCGLQPAFRSAFAPWSAPRTVGNDREVAPRHRSSPPTVPQHGGEPSERHRGCLRGSRRSRLWDSTAPSNSLPVRCRGTGGAVTHRSGRSTRNDPGGPGRLLVSSVRYSLEVQRLIREAHLRRVLTHGLPGILFPISVARSPASFRSGTARCRAGRAPCSPSPGCSFR